MYCLQVAGRVIVLLSVRGYELEGNQQLHQFGFGQHLVLASTVNSLPTEWFALCFCDEPGFQKPTFTRNPRTTTRSPRRFGSVSKFFLPNVKRMFKTILRIAVQEAFPPHTKGRPALLSFDEAY